MALNDVLPTISHLFWRLADPAFHSCLAIETPVNDDWRAYMSERRERGSVDRGQTTESPRAKARLPGSRAEDRVVTPRRLQAVALSEVLRARTGSLIRDRYVLGRTLADGETAAVIEAADRRMRRAVAVKLFDPSVGEALPYAEARLAAIDHPNLC